MRLFLPLRLLQNKSCMFQLLAIAHRRQQIIEGLVRSDYEWNTSPLHLRELEHFRKGEVAEVTEQPGIIEVS